MTTTALSVREVASPSGISGNKYEIAAGQQRILQMIPGAHDAPIDIVWAMAQIAVALDLNPIIGEVYLAKFEGRYQAIIGVSGYETLANRISRFDYKFAPFGEEELRLHRGELYSTADYGVKITLRNYAAIADAKRLGVEWWPIESYGFWRKKATQKKAYNEKTKRYDAVPDQWNEDSIPNGWSKIMVAEKRALKTAIKRAFSLGHVERIEQQLGAAGDEFEMRVVDAVRDLADDYDLDHAPVYRPEPRREADGDVLWDEDAKAGPSDAPAAPDLMHDGDVPDELWQFVADLRQADRHWSSAMCTPAQQGYLVGLLREITGGKHEDVTFAALLGRAVSAENRVSMAAAALLLKHLARESKVKEGAEWVKKANPHYSEEKAEAVAYAYHWAVANGVGAEVAEPEGEAVPT